MNTVEEMVKVCDNRLKELGMTRAELLRRAEQSPTLFSMALRRKYYFGIESLVAISQVLGLSITTLMGIENNNIPDDIKTMENMLLKIPEKDRKLIAMNITNYYKIAMDLQKDGE